jgi:hypothetical protein
MPEVLNTESKWALIGGIVMAFLEVSRRLVTWRFFADRDSASQRRELWAEIGAMRDDVKALRGEVSALRFELAVERIVSARQRELKHFYRGRLSAACLVLEIYRMQNGRHEEDVFRWTPDEPEPDTQSSSILKEMLSRTVSLQSAGVGPMPITMPTD